MVNAFFIIKKKQQPGLLVVFQERIKQHLKYLLPLTVA